jgi:hypothetical protein
LCRKKMCGMLKFKGSVTAVNVNSVTVVSIVCWWAQY